MKKLAFRLILGICFALPLVLVTTAWAQADSEPLVVTQTDLNCQACHPAFYSSWQHSAHGMATDDPTFVDSWEADGKPFECLQCHTTGYDPRTQTWEEDGITCSACHGPIAENHPNEPMPTTDSAELCGTCHTETLFEWQVSKHRQADMDCIDCHGQHSTSLKAEDAEAMCAACHNERALSYTHTAHDEVGLSCPDCHLAQLDGEIGEGHAYRDHSFHVKLSTCNECHEYQMHDPSAVHTDDSKPTIEPDALASVETAGVSMDPEPISPVYFVLLAALMGMAFGLLLAPWIERWYRRLTDVHVDIDDN